MQYHLLGSTDLQVSRLCLGSMTWGQQNTEAQAHEQLDYAVAQGINFIDAAEMYPVPPKAETQGLTEAYIGSWLKQRGGREQLVLATKVTGPADFVSYLRKGPRLNREHIRQAIEGSLQRLQTDYIDLYQLHWPSRSTNFFGQLGYMQRPDDPLTTPLQDTLEVLQDLVTEGKVRYIGLSNETPWGVMHCVHLSDSLGLPRVQSVQNPYNLLNRTFEVGLAEVAHREKTGLLAYSPLAFGTLSGKYLDQQPKEARVTLFPRFDRYNHPHTVEAIRAYVALAKEHGLEPTQMALAFVNTRSFLTSTIIGATSMAQLRSNIESLAVNLNADVLKGLKDIHSRFTYPAP